MPDTILSVEFASEGARAGAPTGSYPIVPSAIRFQGDARVRYSLRYVPGTMDVAALGNIAFVRKTTAGRDLQSGLWTVPITQPDSQNMLVAILVTSRGSSDTGPDMLTVADATTMTNATGNSYTRAGGIGYNAQLLYDDYHPIPDEYNDYSRMISIWTKPADAGTDDATVKITMSDGAPDQTNLRLVVLEYSGPSTGSPVSDVAKVQVGYPPGIASATGPMSPGVDLNNTSGQAVVAAFVAFAPGAFVPFVPSLIGPVVAATGFTNRHTDGALVVFDKTGLSGIGPIAPGIVDEGGGNLTTYIGLAIALTK